ncbi:MAG: TlpA family protein disulfide reductase [Anaerolineales bacterium]
MKLPARLSLLFAILVLTGCAAPASAPTPTAIVSGPSAVSIAVASNDFEMGTPRIPFVLFEGASPIQDAQSVQVQAFDLSSGTAVPGWSGEAVSYSDYDPPYWVIQPQLPHAGFWGLGAIITLADSTQTPGQFTVEALEKSSGPDVGDIPPASANRTQATEPDLSKLTSDPQPEPGLYQLTVADALKSGKPTVVTFATPAFCESRLCAPVVDSVKSVYGEMKDSANFIHIEVYKTFDPLVYADEMEQWRLPSEPWTFVLDRSGKIAARFGGPVAPREITAALEPLLAP